MCSCINPKSLNLYTKRGCYKWPLHTVSNTVKRNKIIFFFFLKGSITWIMVRSILKLIYLSKLLKFHVKVVMMIIYMNEITASAKSKAFWVLHFRMVTHLILSLGTNITTSTSKNNTINIKSNLKRWYF